MRQCIRSLAIAALTMVAVCAMAQDYPNKPIRLVVPFPPAGNVDVGFGRLPLPCDRTSGWSTTFLNGGHTFAQAFATARLRARAESRLQCSIASMASTTWRTASFSLSVRWGFQQSINRIKRGSSERFQASC